MGKHPDYAPLQNEMKGFEKAVKLKSRKFVPSGQQQQSIRDKLDVSTVRFLSSGTIVKKYGDKGKAKKKILKVNDDCSLLLFEDPNGAKAPKQLNMRSVKGVVQGAQANGVQDQYGNAKMGTGRSAINTSRFSINYE